MPFVDSARQAADANRKALGFFPKSVFFEFAHRELLLIATIQSGEEPTYAGHLLFDCRFPKAHVLQILAHPQFRRHRIAQMLLESLKDWLTLAGFISIHARVAQDLTDANAFWERQGFYVQSLAPGGRSSGRTILVRCFELPSPQLIAASGLSLSHPLGVAPRVLQQRAMYLLDLNVFFDLGPRRQRNPQVIELFRADRAGQISLAMSSEFKEEMNRTATAGRTDPMLDYARVFPVFELLGHEASENLLSELAGIVFPNNAGWPSLNPQQRSDLKHIATAIQHQLTGLITSDEAILAAAYEIGARYRVEILSPSALRLTEKLLVRERDFQLDKTSNIQITQTEAKDYAEIGQFLSGVGVSAGEIQSTWMSKWDRAVSPPGLVARVSTKVVAYLHFAPRSVVFDSHLAVDGSSPYAKSATEVLLQQMLASGSSRGVAVFTLRLPRHQAAAREVAWNLGFRDFSHDSDLAKVTVRQVVTVQNWPHCRRRLMEVAGLQLPETLPDFSSIDQQLPITTSNGVRIYLSLDALESLMGPALFCVAGRAAVLTPIRRQFSDELFGHSRQMSLLAHSKARVHSERHYLSAKRTLKKFSRGALILFYETGKQRGAAGVVAVARVRRVYTKVEANLDDADFAKSVLDQETLHEIGVSKVKTVTVFDNLLPFEKVVPLSKLRELGCGKASDLISTTTLTSSQALAIVREGFSDA
jgi:GNAT superfamily N-acetyltransferase